MKETTLRTPSSVKKEGGRGARDAGGESLPLQLLTKSTVRQVVSLKPMKVHCGAEIHLQPVEGTPRQSRWMPEGSCDPLQEPRAGAGSCQDLQTHGEGRPRWSRFAGRACDPMGDPCWSSLLLKDCTPWEGPTLGQFVKSCGLWEGLILEKFVEHCFPGEGPHSGAREECEESSP